MTAKNLKNALLQEAVQGKLVPQIASEGNARDLLEEIKKEKLSHGFANSYGICDGKNKKTKSSDLRSKSQIRVTTEITEDEIPFEIPENWCWCRLGEVTEIARGGSPRPIKDYLTTDEDGYNWIKIGDTDKDGKYINRTAEKIKKEGLNKTRFVHKGDFLLTNSMSFGRPYILNIDGCIHDGWLVISPKDNIFNKDFLYYVLSSTFAYNQFCDSVSGAVVKNLNSDKVRESLFPLPPLAEQKRIVAAIEKFMPLIEEYSKKETQLKAINEKIGTFTKKAILQEAVQGKLVPQIASEGNARDLLEEIRNERLSHGFANSYGICSEKGKKSKSSDLRSKSQIRVTKKELPEITEDEIPFDIPENWCWCRLSELCNLYTGDSINETEKKLKYTNIKEGWFYIGTKDVNFDQTINYDNGIKIPFEKDNFRIAPKNTVLMCIEGGSAGRKIAFTNQDVCFGNKLCCFNSYKNEIEKFIFYFLQSTLFTDAFKDNINGIIGGVSINNLKGMLFPLPPLAEQKRIVAAIEKMLPLCEKLGE